MPALNGACTDINSLQTGPNTAGITNLCWQPLLVVLATDGRLSVSYKNISLVTNFFTSFTPSPGRLIFAGRTGGSWQEQDVDNIRITTVSASTPVVGPSTGNANGFRFNIVDSGFATPETNTLMVTLDGVAVPVTAITQSGAPGGGNGITTVGYRNTALLLAPGSTHTNTVQFTGSTFNGTVSTTNIFTVPNYTILASTQKAPGPVNTSLSGFTGRIHQMPVPRFPNAGDLLGIERHLADGYIDPVTSQPYTNIALASSFTNQVLNWAQDQPIGGSAGHFSVLALPPMTVADDPVPGIDENIQPSTDHIAAEILTILELPVGAYQLGVNHDDGFKLSIGAEPRDVFNSQVLSVSTAATDTQPIDIVVTNAGRYPFRLVWAENTGGAHVEFYLIDLTTGQRLLVNQSEPAAIVAYHDTAALTQPYVQWTAPAPNQTGIAPTAPVIAKLQDGSAASITSASLSINGGGTSSMTKVGGLTTVTLTGYPFTGNTATASLVYNTTAGGPFTNTWNFSISYFGQRLFEFSFNEGNGNNIIDSAQGLTGTFVVGNAIWTNGPTGNPTETALFFDTARRISVPDPGKLITLGENTSGTNGDYTVEAWVRLPLGYEPTARMVMLQYENGVPSFSFSINTARTLHTTTFTLNDVNSTAVVPNDGQWHHVAVVHENGVRMLFYIDGVLLSGVPYTRGPGTRTTPALTIGAAGGGANGFMGSMDRLRFTKGALTPSQFDIASVPPADQTPGDVKTGLLAHLRLDETSGLTAFDSSGNSHDGTLVNFPGDNSQWVPGKLGGGLAFNNQYVVLTDPNGALNFANIATFSLAAWIKATPFQAASGVGLITKGTGGGGEQFNIDILTATGTGGNGGALRFFVRNAAGATS
ncbi:MAG TPA: LamG-like jellyroll fold domain-containing protein, partial [Clostridia bacterium]|nr:LamG-like jellyroll fold domain-containing protein [Clostridia bacterium]